jgi:hypothetical protein
MAHFYLSAQGSRGAVTRCGTKASGIDAHVRGWGCGVKVYARCDSEGRDCFDVYQTGGSNGGTSTFLGTVTTDEGFEPAERPSEKSDRHQRHQENLAGVHGAGPQEYARGLEERR